MITSKVVKNKKCLEKIQALISLFYFMRTVQPIMCSNHRLNNSGLVKISLGEVTINSLFDQAYVKVILPALLEKVLKSFSWIPSCYYWLYPLQPGWQFPLQLALLQHPLILIRY